MLACGVLAMALAAVPSVKLNNGVEMPVLAFGAQVWDDDTCKSATTAALEAGFRFIWSSALIGSTCQQAQGVAISEFMTKTNASRSEMFIAGTVNTASCNGQTECYTQTKDDAEQQFDILGQKNYLDMLMLDYPASSGGCDSLLGQWQAFSELYAAKRVRSIAVSNFAVDQLKCVINGTAGVVPTANQLQYSVGHGSDTAVADDAALGVVLQAYSPLDGGSLPTDPDCVAIGNKYNKTGAQVALKWIIQRNGTVCTESTEKEYLLQDVDIFDFTLDADDMATLNAK